MGRAYPGHRVAVVDHQGKVLPPANSAKSPCIASANGEDDPGDHARLLAESQATAEKFVGDGWGLTGDLAKIDEDGDLWYQGRADDVFNSGGYRIGPAEIENCLLKHPAVANCAVIGIPDALRGTLVKAFVVLQPGGLGSPALVEQLQQQVRQHLAPYETPKAIEFVEACR
jgi:acetyl-CoA synthetase